MFILNQSLFKYAIYLVYTTNIFGICSLSGFSGQHHSRPDSAAQDIYPDNDRLDPNDLQDFELPDQQTLIDAFLRGLCKESECEFRGLSHLLASLPDPSLGQGQVEAVPVTVARERGVIPEASHEALLPFSISEMKLYKHDGNEPDLSPGKWQWINRRSNRL